MRRHYPDGPIEAPGLVEFNTQVPLVRLGATITLKILTRNFTEKTLTCVETPHGLKIDWESWAGWSEVPWSEFIASKPTTSQVFRLMLGPADYYNIGFSNDIKWQSYRLTSPDGSHVLYGYAERGTPLNAKLRPPPETPQTALILALKFPEHAASSNQVVIENCLADSWLLDPETPR